MMRESLARCVRRADCTEPVVIETWRLRARQLGLDADDWVRPRATALVLIVAGVVLYSGLWVWCAMTGRRMEDLL